MTNSVNILKEIREDALNIGNEANLSRAIPYVRDGLKPSQRAVIFGAYEQGYSSKKPHVKSLKLDGLVVGSWWPHGSEYLTIARLTQPFVMNIPLLDMHGANGSQLGTPDAASSRYTEVRLAKACEDGLLKNIEKETCDWIPNYSEDKFWPKVLPALLPNLFVNGSDGMGYCYSQTWLPGNLKEFYCKVREYLETGKITYTDIYPDFPTRGTIINKKDIAKIYETGIGTVVLRGKAEIVDNVVKITELPYQVYVTPYLEQLKALITPNSKGEVKISGISDIYNMSGDSGMLIEIECEADPEIILNKLYQYSNLQVSLSANQYGIIDGIPELINLKRYIEVYISHNINTIIKEYSYELNKASQRLEIVSGLIRATSQLDAIVAEIRSSRSTSEAIANLKTKFGFTNNQAQAITDMRLGKLANTELAALAKEESQLKKIIADCKKLLDSDKAQKKEFLKRLDAFVTEYGWDRRTLVQDIDLASEKANLSKKVKIIEHSVILLEANNKIKRLAKEQIKKAGKNAIEIADDQKLILISNFGLMYKLPVKQLTKTSINSTSTDLKTFLDLKKGEQIIKILSGAEEGPYLFFITKTGLAKKTSLKDLVAVSKNVGTTAMKLDEKDEIILCKTLNQELITVLYNGKEKIINTDKFICKSRTAGGVCAVKTKAGSFVSLPLL